MIIMFYIIIIYVYAHVLIIYIFNNYNKNNNNYIQQYNKHTKYVYTTDGDYKQKIMRILHII